MSHLAGFHRHHSLRFTSTIGGNTQDSLRSLPEIDLIIERPAGAVRIDDGIAHLYGRATAYRNFLELPISKEAHRAPIWREERFSHNVCRGRPWNWTRFPLRQLPKVQLPIGDIDNAGAIGRHGDKVPSVIREMLILRKLQR